MYVPTFGLQTFMWKTRDKSKMWFLHLSFFKTLSKTWNVDTYIIVLNVETTNLKGEKHLNLLFWFFFCTCRLDMSSNLNLTKSSLLISRNVLSIKLTSSQKYWLWTHSVVCTYVCIFYTDLSFSLEPDNYVKTWKSTRYTRLEIDDN